MNRYTQSDRTELPVTVHMPESHLPHVRLRQPHQRREDEPGAVHVHDPIDTQAPSDSPRKRYPTLRMAVLCVLLAAGATAMLLPAIQSAVGGSGSWGQIIGGALLGGGLPPTHGEDDAGMTDTESERTTDAEETLAEVVTDPLESVPIIPTESDDGTGADTTATTSQEPPETTWPVESTTFDVESDSNSDSEPSIDETVTGTSPNESEADSESLVPETDSKTDPAQPSETEPESMPDGAFAIVSEDRSEPERSVGYIQSTANRLPPAIPGEETRLWSTAGMPTVLIVHTHPFEGYHDGPTNWYDPSTGAPAQTDSPNDPDGVVALGAQLTRELREAGVTVIHLRIPIGEDESAGSTYDRTEEQVRYYCDLYPDIGLILDLRRSAELTDEGHILRTEGVYRDEACAQLRFSVSADRPTDCAARDIAAAVALRRTLWAIEPTLSRPVWAKNGAGLAAERANVISLTVEFGAAGNRFSEAERLVEPLSAALVALLKK